MSEGSAGAQAYSRRLRERAAADPHGVGVIVVAADGYEARVTLGEIESLCNRSAGRLRHAGVGADSLVVVELPNGVEHLAATFAAWRLGACVLPVSPRLPGAERQQILEVARSWRSTCVVGADDAIGSVDCSVSDLVDNPDLGEIPDLVPWPGKAMGSGGSTGRPKIIVDPAPWTRVKGDYSNIAPARVGIDEVQLVTGQLYHNTGFSLLHRGFFDGHVVVLMEKFSAELALDLVERHHVTFMACVPTVLQRMAKVADFGERDLSSIRCIYHTGGFAPDWMRLAWFERVAPERVVEAYGAAENFGRCVIRGDEWLDHRGSVGRPVATEVQILDTDLCPVAVGEVGEVYMRRRDIATPTFFYVGSPSPRSTDGGLMTAGDLGFVDDDGYLHLVDRRVDMIVSGGANVYCAEVEQAITSHPAVLDAAVIGVPDPEWGRHVHAVVQARSPESPPAVTDLDFHVRTMLASFKVPKTWEFVERLPRDESGKLRRRALLDARVDEDATDSGARHEVKQIVSVSEPPTRPGPEVG